jgi:hypothetical protein
MEAVMSATVVNREACLEWSSAARALPGQSVCGDLHFVSTWSDGALFAVADGLGHGDEATAAATAAVDAIAENPREPIVALFQRCHRALQRTRGVALTVVSLDTEGGRAAMLGVGNVEAVLLRGDPDAQPRRESVLLRNGVVGYRLPPLHTHATTFARGDLLVFATDGVRPDFGDSLTTTEPIAQLVDRIMVEKFRGNDDGLVLAVKYLGKP